MCVDERACCDSHAENGDFKKKTKKFVVARGVAIFDFCNFSFVVQSELYSITRKSLSSYLCALRISVSVVIASLGHCLKRC